MEEFPKNNSEQGGENNLSPEMQELADMAGKMGKTHEKSYEEAKRDGELPEGVRDENDYREYLEEKGAREAETEEQFKTIVEKIDSLDTDSEKRIFTAVLGAGADVGLLAKFANSTDVFSSESLLKFINEEYDNGKITKKMFRGTEQALMGEQIYAMGESDEFYIHSDKSALRFNGLNLNQPLGALSEECRPAIREHCSVIRYAAKNIIEEFDKKHDEDDKRFLEARDFKQGVLFLLTLAGTSYIVKCDEQYEKTGVVPQFDAYGTFGRFLLTMGAGQVQGAYSTVVDDIENNRGLNDDVYRGNLKTIGFYAAQVMDAIESYQNVCSRLQKYKNSLKQGEKIISEYKSVG